MERNSISPTLFDNMEDHEDQSSLVRAEHVLLDLADYIYAHTSLKPISKTLFYISRVLTVAKAYGDISSEQQLLSRYKELRASLNGEALSDDYDFESVATECQAHVSKVLKAVNEVCRLTKKSDSLGLVFNTLLRGKFEGGEGLGTFLTPEEVVSPMVDMLFETVSLPTIMKQKKSVLFGDICGGTGRFVYAIANRLEKAGASKSQISRSARLFDQSAMAVDLGRLNFLCEGITPHFHQVDDSLTSIQVSRLAGKFLLLATNPPFGSSKYQWNEGVASLLPPEVLGDLRFTGPEELTDPAGLFLFRNLDLLKSGGAVAIVLPDGVIHSASFRNALTTYEQVRKTHLDIRAIVSLPSATFALGGTVAKTSFVIIKKSDKSPKAERLYVAIANHVGFLKRGKKRADDPNGNDLIEISNEFASSSFSRGKEVGSWRSTTSFMPTRLLHLQNGQSKKTKTVILSTVVDAVRVSVDVPQKKEDSYHISILDVDETGLIDVIAASQNEPVSKGLECQPFDILVSCLNPKIWRVAVVPDLPGKWSCSPEFAVLRAKDSHDAWRIGLAMHHPIVVDAIRSMAKGTSSSRQRVPKSVITEAKIPMLAKSKEIASYVEWRTEYYEKRLIEATLYQGLHDGGLRFSW